MSVSTHVLDASVGQPAAGVDVRLEQRDGADWREVGSGRTDTDGRLKDWQPTPTPTQAQPPPSAQAQPPKPTQPQAPTEAPRAGHDGSGEPWPAVAGDYRLVFGTGGYFAQRGVAAFHPEVVVTFRVADPAEHHHVPLLLSPYSYTTYRGS